MGTTSVGRTVFEIEEGEVRLVSKNERIEKHGDEGVLACDLGFVWETDNGVLACFSPTLKAALYEKSGQGELVDDPGHVTHLRFPQLGMVTWGGGEIVGARVVFHQATGKKSEVALEGVKVNKFKLECKEGGTVAVHFRVQISPLEEHLSGKLSKFLAQELCTVSVTPPAASEEAGAGSPLH